MNDFKLSPTQERPGNDPAAGYSSVPRRRVSTHEQSWSYTTPLLEVWTWGIIAFAVLMMLGQLLRAVLSW